MVRLPFLPTQYMKSTEKHPLTPFLPEGAKILMLGSFPPKEDKWSMRVFYPNWINDMGRIGGTRFHGDKHHFEVQDEKRFAQERIVDFCTEKGIALYDTACEVRRLKNNASDKYLEVVTPTDLTAILQQIPQCKAIVTTGQKATDIIVETFTCKEPPIGSMETIAIAGGRTLHFWRMPSSSRAYPLALDKKAEYYRKMFEYEQIYVS